MVDAWFFGGVTLIYSSYFILILAFHRGLAYWRNTPPDPDEWPSVSLVIAARNEEKNLPDLFRSLVKLTYPTDRFDIILIDDQSNDRTRELCDAFAAERSKVSAMTTTTNQSILNGKARALAQGIARATGDIIAVTDADCEVSPHWVQAHVRWYKAGYDMVGGITLLTKNAAKAHYFERWQSQDWLYLTAASSGAGGFGMPFSILGNNSSFRREMYERLGGFENIRFNLCEDLALMRAFEEGGGRVALPCTPDIVVQSKPTLIWRELSSQCARWISGAKPISVLAKITLALGCIGRIFPLLFLIFGHYAVGFATLIAAAFFDFSIFFHSARTIHRTDHLKKFPFYLLFSIVTWARLIPILFKRSVEWKGRVYQN